MTKEKIAILVVDDDPSITGVLKLILEARGYEVDVAYTGTDAVQKSKAKIYNLAILDIKLPDIEGTKLLKAMRETSPKMVKIMLTGFPQLQNAIDALNDGADAYFVKPADPDKLLKTIEEKLAEQKEDREIMQEKIAVFLKARTEKLLQEME
ncbi:MAG: response regulator [Candidatus Bathyarchaeota archaeon]|nr:response regulator [Candidatus Bathyarchaeota archaeon]